MNEMVGVGNEDPIIPLDPSPDPAVRAVASHSASLLALGALLRSRKRPVVTGGEALIGAEGEAVAWQDGDGRVRVKGEIWLARSDAPLAAGSRVKIVSRDGLVLRVEAVRPA